MSRGLLFLIGLNNSNSRKVCEAFDTEPVAELTLHTIRDARVSELHLGDLLGSLIESFEVGRFLSFVVEKDHHLVSFSEGSV